MNRDPILELLREWRVPASDQLELLGRRVSAQVRANGLRSDRTTWTLRATVLTIAAVMAVVAVKFLFSLTTAVHQPAASSVGGHAPLHTARHTPLSR